VQSPHAQSPDPDTITGLTVTCDGSLGVLWDAWGVEGARRPKSGVWRYMTQSAELSDQTACWKPPCAGVDDNVVLRSMALSLHA